MKLRVTLCASLLAAACGWGPEMWQAARDREVEAATRALAAATDDVARAQAHVARGRALSEKARYARVTRTLPGAECERLFAAAMLDLDRAVALAPADVSTWMTRGRARVDNVDLEATPSPAARARLAAARADFSAVLARDARSADAYDWRGLAALREGEVEAALADFQRELELAPERGRLRLADAHCARGLARQRDGQLELAAADFEKSIAQQAPADACECQPETPLAWCYLELRRYDESWRVVHAAERAGRPVASEVVVRLKQDSGRTR